METRLETAAERPAAPQDGQPQARRRRGGGPSRLLVFPVLLHMWPLLLLISQKALVPFGLLVLGAGSRLTRRNIFSAALVMAIAALLLAVQQPNEFAVAHYFGFALFALSIPLINAAVRTSRNRLIKWLSILSICNALLAFTFYISEVDLSQFRGLNRIVGDDDAAHRVYFETTSLLAVFSVAFLRQRLLRWVCGVIVAAYALLLAKSIFVILLFMLNHFAPRVVSGRLITRIAVSVLLIIVAIGAPTLVAIARPDFALSVGIKILQFQTILTDSAPILSGNGWGYVIDEIINSPDQPYQVEMQLPMFLKQVGLLVLIPFALGMLGMVRSISGTWTATLLRFGTYFAVGFANPWLFIPSWYLTVALMYRQFDDPR